MSNKFQNEDFKSEAELISAGATKSSLLNTTKIYSQKSSEILETVLRKNNFAGTVAPLVTNDSSQGYEVGSVWIDTVGQKSYNCISNGVGTALWKEGGGGVATSNGLTAIVSIANNQVAAVDTGIVFSYPTIKSFEIFAQIIRTTSTTASTEVTKILGVYDIATSAWVLTDVAANNSGVTFSITAIGQLQYTSTNMAGSSYVGEMVYSYQANGGAISGTSPNNISSDGLNYITTGNAESGTTGWTTYADAAGTRPIDGTGGVANITFTESSVAPLRGLKSFIFTKDAVNRQGHGADFDFTIDNASLAKVLTIDFDYLVNSGTFVAGTNTTDSDVIVSIYDVTNARIIEPSSIKLFGNSTTVANKFSATFQTSSNSLLYRLIFHVASTSALSYSLKIDNISVSPSKYVYGTPISDWRLYTPVLSNAGTAAGSLVGFHRRVGDSAEVNVIYVGSVAGSGALNVQFSMPTGLNFDTTKVSNNNILGGASVYNLAGTTLFNYTGVQITSVNQMRIIKPNAGNSAIGTDLTSNTQIEIKATIPIQGWSSSVQMSDSADTRVCAAIITGTLQTSYTAGNNITFSAPVARDTHGAYGTVTGLYTVPVSGFYKVSGWFNTNLAANSTITVHVNGVSQFIIGSCPTATGYVPFSGLIYADAGQTISIRSSSNWSAVGAGNNLTFERVTGPSSIAANESINCRINHTSGQAIATNTHVPLIFNLKDYDSHGAFNTTTGEFTAPISGKYNIQSAVVFTNLSVGGNGTVSLSLAKNGTLYCEMARFTTGSTGTMLASSGISGSTQIQLNAGDKITVTLFQNGTGSPTLQTSSTPYYNWISVERVGN